MKREIFATLLILFVVLRGITKTVDDVEYKHDKEDIYYDSYEEIISQDIIFEDEFDGSMSELWDVQDDQTKYNRLSVNQAENITFSDLGNVILTTKQEVDGSFTTPYMSLEQDSNGNNLNYGYYEAKLKFTNNNDYEHDTALIPGTDVLKPWGAFWLFPLAQAANDATEIDIAENSVSDVVSASLHEINNYEPIDEVNASSWYKGEKYDVDPTHFHTYGVYIEPNIYENAATYSFYLDGVKVGNVVSQHPLGNQTLHLSMEIASEDYEEGRQGEPIDEVTNFEDESMIVDYVRIYKYNERL